MHLEEDTGKLLHLPSGGSGVDYNRAGVPLMEIVTDFPPDISTSEEAKEYLTQLRLILLYLGVCDGKMEEGSLRCEPNISVRPEGQSELGTKTELKNLGSFRAVQLGVRFEVERQVALIESGGKVQQETRGWNEDKEQSYLMRVKETENDYRYFPDPDLVPMCFDEAYIEELRKSLPELPLAKMNRYVNEWGLSRKEATQLVSDVEWAGYFEEAVGLGGDAKLVTNWMNNELAGLLNRDGLSARQSKISPQHIVGLIQLVSNGKINGKQAKEVFATAYKDGRMPDAIVAESGASQITDRKTLAEIVEKAVQESPDIVNKYKAGQTNVKGYLVGQVMRQTKGQANPELVQELLSEILER